MRDLQTLLSGADPVTQEPELSPADARAMRRVILAAERTRPVTADTWSGAVPIAAVVIITVAIGVSVGRRLPVTPLSDDMGASVVTESDAAERTHVQFATPGGTQIIWTLDPEFDLRGLTP
jgi:hypothetical protein